MSVTNDEVRHIAELARLEMTEAAIAELVPQLNNILAHVDALQRVDTEGVEPAIGVGAEGMPLRADRGPQYPMERDLRALAPAMRDGFVLVPRLATHEALGAGSDGGEAE